MRRAVMFAPERILSMECILGLTRSQIASVKRVVCGGEVSRGAMAELIEAAGEALENAFEAESLDTATILTAALVVRQGDGGQFARMVLDAAIVRGLLTEDQRRAATLTLAGSPSVFQHRGPSLFGYARDPEPEAQRWEKWEGR